jgi:hypothetical protein
MSAEIGGCHEEKEIRTMFSRNRVYRLSPTLSLPVLVSVVMPGAPFAQTISGPVPGSPVLGQNTFATAPPGYVVQEFFLSGSAEAYKASGQGGHDVIVCGSAAYTTRIVVVRPKSAAQFNGTVIVEWLNVSAGTDGAPDWTYTHRELLRKGFAYVAVSAQKVGIDGSPLGIPGLLSIRHADPQRYASLDHPGDSYAYDIFSQAGQAVRSGGRQDILGSLEARHLIATGESQSAAFLTTYVNAIDPINPVFDGYLIHSRFGGTGPLDGYYMVSRMARAATPVQPVKIRDDVRVPVMMVITETDLMVPDYGYLIARQADTNQIRTWEIAGTAHADTYTLAAGSIDTETVSIDTLAEAYAPISSLFGQQLSPAMNAAPQHHYVMQAALASLNHWVCQAKAPPKGSRLEVTETPATLKLDINGNALGGIRSPWVDVPTSVLSGLGQSAPGLLALFGSTKPFDAATMAKLYSGGCSEYLGKFRLSLLSAIDAGFILQEDEAEIMALAAAMYQVP